MTEKWVERELAKNDFEDVESKFIKKQGKEHLGVFYQAAEKVMGDDDSWRDEDVKDMLKGLDLDNFAYGKGKDTWY